ncbi:MAG: hypothetical protein J6N72_07975 [Psychrobacter sp.]|nr:hypothetical protein [Psychrobacter sp.]
MTTQALKTDSIKKATAQDIGAYFFQTKADTVLNMPAISENAVMLGKAMINTFDQESVDSLELLDGFIDCNCGGRGGHGGRAETYLGFTDNAKNLTFFNVNKVAVLEVMEHVIEHDYDGDRKRYLHELAYSKSISSTSGINPQEDDLYHAFTAMITGGNEHQPVDTDLQAQITLAVLNDVVYQSLSSYDCIQEMVDFISE